MHHSLLGPRRFFPDDYVKNYVIISNLQLANSRRYTMPRTVRMLATILELFLIKKKNNRQDYFFITASFKRTLNRPQPKKTHAVTRNNGRSRCLRSQWKPVVLPLPVKYCTYRKCFYLHLKEYFVSREFIMAIM